MKMDPMKEALKKRAAKHVSIEISIGKEGSPEEEAKETPEFEKQEREAMGLAPDTAKGKSKGHPQPPDAKMSAGDDMKAEGDPKDGPAEDGDADLKTILARMGDMGNIKGSLSNKAKEGMKNKLAKKG